MTHTALIPNRDGIPAGVGHGDVMARILIREDAPVLERLLATIAARAGHETIALGRCASRGVDGDVLLLDPLAVGAAEWVSALRATDSPPAVVCVGADPGDPEATAFRPLAIVRKPFTVTALDRAIADALAHGN